MFSKEHINQLDRIITEIDNYDPSYLLNEDGMGCLQKFYTDNFVLLKVWYFKKLRSISIYENYNSLVQEVIEFHNIISASSLSSIVHHDTFYSNGKDPITYNCIKLSDFTKDEYFNMMVSSTKVIGYNCIELGSDVDELFFRHKMHGRIKTNLNVDLSLITVK